MSLHNPFGWSLPPGVTNADIDKHFGDAPQVECKTCGELFDPEDEETECEPCRTSSPCCGVKFDEDTEICPKCGEHI